MRKASAEITGRPDLAKARDGKRYQRMDAESLLRPLGDQRDDQLAGAYLAFRLGVRLDELSMPSTPVAGWCGLALRLPSARDATHGPPDRGASAALSHLRPGGPRERDRQRIAKGAPMLLPVDPRTASINASRPDNATLPTTALSRPCP
jgi:hypothetical protein